MSRLDEIKARADAATEGPWSAKGGFTSDPMIEVYGQTVFINPDLDGDPIQPEVWADVEFIAAAREDVPWLVSEIERLTRVIDAKPRQPLVVLNEYLDRTERAEAEVARLTAERDALAAQVARVEEVLDHWRTVDEGNAAYAERIGERSRFADGLASRADMLRAALSGSGADTTDTQPTDQEDQS